METIIQVRFPASEGVSVVIASNNVCFNVTRRHVPGNVPSVMHVARYGSQ